MKDNQKSYLHLARTAQIIARIGSDWICCRKIPRGLRVHTSGAVGHFGELSKLWSHLRAPDSMARNIT